MLGTMEFLIVCILVVEEEATFLEMHIWLCSCVGNMSIPNNQSRLICHLPPYHIFFWKYHPTPSSTSILPTIFTMMGTMDLLVVGLWAVEYGGLKVARWNLIQ